MKLMYFLMDRDEQREKRLELQFEVRPPPRAEQHAMPWIDR